MIQSGFLCRRCIGRSVADLPTFHASAITAAIKRDGCNGPCTVPGCTVCTGEIAAREAR
jgi:hypothetical protein